MSVRRLASGSPLTVIVPSDGRVDAGQRLHERRLARAALADDRDELAGLDAQRRRLQDHLLLDAHAEALGVEPDRALLGARDEAVAVEDQPVRADPDLRAGVQRGAPRELPVQRACRCARRGRAPRCVRRCAAPRRGSARRWGRRARRRWPRRGRSSAGRRGTGRRASRRPTAAGDAAKRVSSPVRKRSASPPTTTVSPLTSQRDSPRKRSPLSCVPLREERSTIQYAAGDGLDLGVVARHRAAGDRDVALGQAADLQAAARRPGCAARGRARPRPRVRGAVADRAARAPHAVRRGCLCRRSGGERAAAGRASPAGDRHGWAGRAARASP